MPLDAYLEDVPAEKLVVLGNHRSAQSNVLFIRNTDRGRQLARDWLAVVVSGYVQCHGFDQVGKQLVQPVISFEYALCEEHVCPSAQLNHCFIFLTYFTYVTR